MQRGNGVRDTFGTDALRLLLAVADTGSFTAAAQRLAYTQSAVSRRIAALERQAGGPLFVRLPRGVRLTPAGAALHRHATEVLDRLARAEAELAAIHAGRGGTLRVGAFATANIALVPAALRAFTRARPDVEVVAVEGRSDALVQRLADGALDIAVVSDYPSGLPSAEGVTTDALLADELYVGLPPDHRLAASADAVQLGDLRDESWIQDAPAGGHPALLLDACAQAGFAPRKLIRVAEWSGKFGYVAAGLGVALVPSLALWAVPPDLALRPLAPPFPRRTVHTALPPSPLPSARLLADLLRAAARPATRTGGPGRVRTPAPRSPADGGVERAEVQAVRHPEVRSLAEQFSGGSPGGTVGGLGQGGADADPTDADGGEVGH
ncbi:LysR family transcriptional regulator [Streptomyces sp. NPDC088910]|uniref:LysR family transcriptional regulator n=1 Tax=Streptomyces sp. NPDC088910 TaxID=3365911 RepID=UPI003801EA7E